jgi:hypothetical protein
VGDFSRFNKSDIVLLKKWYHLLYPDTLNPSSSGQPTKVVESPKERLQRLWNQLNPDEQVDWKNYKPPIISPEISFWMKHYCEYVSDEEMYQQDYGDEDTDDEGMGWYEYYLDLGWIEDHEGGLRDNDPFSHT